MIERIGLWALHRLDPERAHSLSIRALKARLVPLPRLPDLPRLRTDLCGMALKNPLGLAAGYDKNAVAIAPLAHAGFGFVEVGAATPYAQSGNPRPRLFRLTEDRAAINRFAFNNDGAQAIADRLAARVRGPVPVGLNLGAGKDSDDRVGDYARVLALCGPHIDFATVNVSSPNTERLRDLQGAEALRAVLDGVMTARAGLVRPVPVFLKIATDLSDAEIAGIAGVAQTTGIDAIIATNTTLARNGLKSPARAEGGGLSGQPLFAPSTWVLARLSAETGGALPLVGVGGIGSADQAYAKIRAGASALQLYTALIYGGFSLVRDILIGLDALLARDGYEQLADAVGTARASWR